MTKIEALKELLKENINELNRNTSINSLSIKFKGDEFTVINKKNKVILKDKLSNYDLDFESQKKFILNVVNKVAAFAEVLEDLDKEYFRDLIKVDDEYYFNVVGCGDIYSNNYVEIDIVDYVLKEIKDIEEYEDEINDIYNDYFNFVAEYIEDKIKKKFENSNIRVVLYSDRYGYNVGFYVDGVIHEDEVCVSYIEVSDDLEEIRNVRSIDELTSYEIITLYYSLAAEKEIDKAIKYIKKFIKLCAKNIVKVLKNVIKNKTAARNAETETEAEASEKKE